MDAYSFLPLGFLADLRALLRIPSVYDGATSDAARPYGAAVADAFAYVLGMGRRDGFSVAEYDGHVVSISLPGTGEGRIDVISHVDVVEPGTGWSRNPFGAEIEGDILYGRGTQDMKAPFLVTYYTLKAIKEAGIHPKRELRLVIGGDEERTMDDMVRYVRKAGTPDFAFTPDSAFPVCLGEKGALMWRIQGSVQTSIEQFEGGVQCNVISPAARAVIRSSATETEYREAFSSLEIFRDGGVEGSVRSLPSDQISERTSERTSCRIEVNVKGIAAHASRPEDGRSATTALCAAIAHVEDDDFARLVASVFSDHYGAGANLSRDIPPMGRLTMNLGILRLKEGKVYGEIDCRYPYGVTSGELTALLQSACPHLEISLDYDAPPTLADAASPFVTALADIYRKATGDEQSAPFISGGVTYAKVVPRCVAFGPLMPGGVSLAHQVDECIDLKDISILLRIYGDAMVSLATMDSDDYSFSDEFQGEKKI
ncbi:dipeptidase [Parasphaerochaeta coccoides DSM 17374]|uniref:Dipeptidase n=2 Tax=Parasphaerochaeta TaxID=3062336 RepID=F4GHK8_PARC1|nr:dipeptidase [Parasphaerochaeta coccoides DSM 17374]